MTAPLEFQWDGEAMVPRHPRLADKAFVVGERYMLAEHNERSSASHRHYFAAIKDVWDNLDDDAYERFPTPEHLRKHALIRCGFADSRSITCASKAEAMRVAAFVRPQDEYAITTIEGATVTVWTAKSQSSRAMGKEQFQQSKQAVLEWLSQLIGVSPETLERNAA